MSLFTKEELWELAPSDLFGLFMAVKLNYIRHGIEEMRQKLPKDPLPQYYGLIFKEFIKTPNAEIIEFLYNRKIDKAIYGERIEDTGDNE